MLGIQKLLKKGGFDYILIETTGIADPGPVAQTFVNIPALQKFVQLDGIITVVDAEQIGKQMDETEVAAEQIAMADFVLLNKTDLVDEAHLGRVSEKIRALNPHTRILRTKQSEAPLAEILDIHAFDVERKLAVDPEFLNEMKAQGQASPRHHEPLVRVRATVRRGAFREVCAAVEREGKGVPIQGFRGAEGAGPARIVPRGEQPFSHLLGPQLAAGRGAGQSVGVHRQETQRYEIERGLQACLAA